jgi:uncharacterized protein YijF (DUF1287 family)
MARLHRALACACILVSIALGACSAPPASLGGSASTSKATSPVALVDRASPQARRLALAAEDQVGKTVRYDAAYVKLDYPGGDVPMDRGVCTDVLVRAFRTLGIDLQVEVHEDMSAHFEEYPQNWGAAEPDSSIDHRRVPNLQTYFRRQGKAVAVSEDPADYWPGDVVTWDVSGRPHTGIVSATPAPDGTRFCMAHNIGAGVRVEDVLFAYKITGHYRPL